MTGKTGFAPVVMKAGPKTAFALGRVTYGVRGYTAVPGRRFRTFYAAERAAEKENRKLGLSDEEAWLLVENTIMAGR